MIRLFSSLHDWITEHHHHTTHQGEGMSQATPDLSTVASARAALVAALRSGEYSQARGRLHKPTGYCCLGVGGDLQVKAGTHCWRMTSDGTPAFDLVEGTDLFARDQYGLVGGALHYLRTPNPFGFTKDDQNVLAFCNDEGHTFAEIADVIEAAGAEGPIVPPAAWNVPGYLVPTKPQPVAAGATV